MPAESHIRKRIDLLLVERGLAASRAQAQRLVMAGQVTVDDVAVTKPGTRVLSGASIAVAARRLYASRAGVKLAAALDAFHVSVEGYVAADVGASTGGFTDCLLQRGASRVYAIDVGYGQLDWSLRQDQRVVVMERTNARYLQTLPEAVDIGTVDVSFISLTLVLPRVRDWLAASGIVVCLIKPQFEAGRRQVGKKGVVSDPRGHQEVLQRILGWAGENGLSPHGLARSPITGPAGNVEFLGLLKKSCPSPSFDVQLAITSALAG